MSKLMIRVSVVGLVLGGAAASAFTPKTHTVSSAIVATHNTLVVPSAIPFPSCAPNDGCI